MKVNKLKHQPEYKGVTMLVIDAIIDVKYKDGEDIETPELLNAFEWEKDLVLTLPDLLKKQVRGNSNVRIKYDNVSGALSIATNYITSHNLSEEDITKLAKWTKHEWSEALGIGTGVKPKEVATIPFTLADEKPITATVAWEDIEAIMLPNYLPKGKMWLATLFANIQDQMMYEEFMVDDIIFGRLKYLCTKKGLKIKDDVTASSQLPVHSVDSVSKEIVVSDNIVNIFGQYKFCRNYLSHGAGTAEHDLGKLMMLYPKLCEFIMDVAKRSAEGIAVNHTEYEKQINKAIKYVSKRGNLMELYSNNLVG